MTEEEYANLLEEGAKIPINCDEKELLQDIYYRVKLWCIEANKELEIGVNIEEIKEQLNSYYEKKEDPDIIFK
jgi:hypothetical protein